MARMLPQATGVSAHPLIPPILNAELEPLPKLTQYPGRIVVPIDDDIDMNSDRLMRDLIAELLAKVNAEHARMMRILPPAPTGKRWVVGLQEGVTDELGPFHYVRRVRAVYKLESDPTA